MPKVAETVFVDYCDFCSEQRKESRASYRCDLCGQLVCNGHSIQLRFLVAPSPGSGDEDYSEISDLLRGISSGSGGRHWVQHVVCVECSHFSLAELVTKLKVLAS